MYDSFNFVSLKNLDQYSGKVLWKREGDTWSLYSGVGDWEVKVAPTGAICNPEVSGVVCSCKAI